MSIVSLPKTTFNLTVAPQPIENSPQKVLFLGQQVTDTNTDRELITNIQPNGQEDTLFGRKSMLAAMIRAYRELDTINRVDAIPFNDAVGAVAATSTVTFVGTATASGTIIFYIQSKVKFVFNVPVAVGDTDLILAAAFASLVNTNDEILVSATDNLDGTVTLTVANEGTVGNFITIEQSGSVGGIVSSITAFAGGTTDPTITGAIFDQVGDTRYNTIVYPAQYDKSVIATFLNNRFNPTNAIEDGVGVTSQTDTQVNLETEADSLNSQSMVLLGNKPVSSTNYEGSALFEYDPVISSYWAAIRSLRLTLGVNIPNFLIGPLLASNPVGGPRVAAIPYFNTPISTLATINTANGWTRVEQNSLNDNGVSFAGNNIANNEVIEGQMVTTYLNNTQGQPDTSYKFLNTVDTGSQIREFFFSNNKNEYAQAVLTDGDVVASYQVNVDSFNAFQLSLYKLLSEDPYNLTVAGSDFYEFFKNNIQTTFDLASGTITTVMIVPIVSQVRAINGTVEIAFNVVTG